MNKQSVWKRLNRGFLVSMILLAGVGLYVLVSQLLLIPERQTLRELADAVRQISDTIQVQEDSYLAQLQSSSDEQEKERNRLLEAMKPLFVKNSSYLPVSAQSFVDEILLQLEGERLTALAFEDNTARTENCTIQGDTATITMSYTYTVSGYFYDYDDIHSEDGKVQLKMAENVEQTYYLSLTCKKEDGEWRIFRVSDSFRNRARDLSFSTEVVIG